MPDWEIEDGADAAHGKHHSKILLRPVNPDFETIELTDKQEGQVQVIAECVEVLSGMSPAGAS